MTKWAKVGKFIEMRQHNRESVHGRMLEHVESRIIINGRETGGVYFQTWDEFVKIPYLKICSDISGLRVGSLVESGIIR